MPREVCATKPGWAAWACACETSGSQGGRSVAALEAEQSETDDDAGEQVVERILEADAARGPWAMENRLRDACNVTSGEDASAIRGGSAPEVTAGVRCATSPRRASATPGFLARSATFWASPSPDY